ncbi:MAG: SUMF1/EgtB/PvdO family nonheme iron enzyme [Verrucomicrobia bacterium]|nr:SUMF1/EgtB/PvdO family nonheme iron enzyme [Verrucomicrobiota bacterium]
MLLLLCIPALHAADDNPFEQAAVRSFSGLFSTAGVRLRLQPAQSGLAGSLEFNGQTNAVKAELIEGRLEGFFSSGATNWPFSMTLEAGGATFKAGKYTARLQKAVLPQLSGAYRGATVSLKIDPKDDGYIGTVQLQGKDLPFTGKDLGGEFAGICGEGEQKVPFTLVSEEGKLWFRSGRSFAESLQPVEPAAPQRIRATPFSSAPRWTNSLGMVFVKVPGTDVCFSIWDTRVQDYQVYAESREGVDDSWRSGESGPTHPVVNVDWGDANKFCDWLTAQEWNAGLLSSSQSYRLPTDAEWSVAVGLQGESGSTPGDKDRKIKDVYPWGNQWPPPRGAGNYYPD